MKTLIQISLIFVLGAAVCSATATDNQSLNKIRAAVEKLKQAKNTGSSPLKGKTLTLQEEEMNSYLAVLVAQKGKGQIQTAKITLLGDKLVAIEAVARVEWKEIFKSNGDSVASKLLSKAGGLGSKVEAVVQTGSAKGKGYVRVQSLKINGITVPDTLVTQLLQYLGEKQRPRMDFSRLFPLPNGIQKIEVQKGSLAVYF